MISDPVKCKIRKKLETRYTLKQKNILNNTTHISKINDKYLTFEAKVSTLSFKSSIEFVPKDLKNESAEKSIFS